MSVSWRVSVCPSGTGLGECTFLEYVSVEYICWYWIYHANTWEMGVSGRVSLCPSGTGLGECTFLAALAALYLTLVSD